MFSSLHANCYLYVVDINSYLQLPLFDNKLCQQMKELTNIAFIINFYFEKLRFCYKYTDVNINIYSHIHIFIYYIYVCVCVYIYIYIYITYQIFAYLSHNFFTTLGFTYYNHHVNDLEYSVTLLH